MLVHSFVELVETSLDWKLDASQREAVEYPVDTSLFIVAGPGSGKTATIVLRALRLIFVDCVDPAAIMATTFTRRAASELRSRILGWGDKIRQAAVAQSTVESESREWIDALDISRIVTGTLDSIAEEVLRDFRVPRAPAPTVIEDFAASALMASDGLFQGGRYQDNALHDFAVALRGTAYGLDFAELRELCKEVRDRLTHDQVDASSWTATSQHPGAKVLLDTIMDYVKALDRDLVLDFAALEQQFLTRLEAGSLSSFTENLRALFVDEYQDTNLLQEQIYFRIAREVVSKGGSMAVVGDDDQSLYRFRGATVDLFRDFEEHISRQCGIVARPVFLNCNYRSTARIVAKCDEFVKLDSEYNSVRIGGKPDLTPARDQGKYIDFPILSMFRSDVAELAHDVANFIRAVFVGDGVRIQECGQELSIHRHPGHGNPGDCAVLCSSARENRGGQPRFPMFLRQELASQSPRIAVFNPRGTALHRVPAVARLCGLILECIDPGSAIQNGISALPRQARDTLDFWRSEAQDFVANAPPPHSPRGLADVMRLWQMRKASDGHAWPAETPLLELVYKLATWIPTMQSDQEGLVYLEVIARTIAQSSRRREPVLSFDSNAHEARSVRSVIWDIFVPLSSGAVDVDEDLLETVPSDRVNIMSIHQAKGLEFPMVIVDVGSDFKTNHRAHRFKRFPEGGSRPHKLEDELRPYCPLGAPSRSGRDRAFDDLVRQYFVAFSRARDILMLVGLKANLARQIPNVATGWTRDGLWRWSGLPHLVNL